MERKKTFTMNWGGLAEYDDDDDQFFETFDRLSSAVPLDLASSGSDDDELFEDPRASFASAISSISARTSVSIGVPIKPDYDIWMAAPGSINERRRRLLQGMGLQSDNEKPQENPNKELPDDFNSTSREIIGNAVASSNGEIPREPEQDVLVSLPSSSSPIPISVPLVLVRSRSGGDIDSFSMDKKRKDSLLGDISKQRLTRTSSMIIVSQSRLCPYHQDPIRTPNNGKSINPFGKNGGLTSLLSNSRLGAFFLIKNLDTGKEFIVNEYNQDGMWNKVSDLQTGKQLTLEEFEKCVGHSPVVKELMRRENFSGMNGGSDGRKVSVDSYIAKSLRISKRRGAAFLKNIKGVAHSMAINGFKVSDKEREREKDRDRDRDTSPTSESKSCVKNQSSYWIKVRNTGKSHKELSALHLCQEIQAHQGSIWSIKFSPDARYLASGGEDRTIHIWEVQECEVMSLNEGNLTPLHPFSAPSLGDSTPMASEKKKKKKKKKRGTSFAKKASNPIPEYVHVSETVFSLSEKPVCSFFGHLDDVLDLSWSRSQLLLSSSMDKTVRLWDMETQSCLKLFAHNDYVTCIQFNPMDDNYFISGSLDNKVRIWSIPDRQLVDWTDLHEMVTAVCYTPDGQGALIGSHKGNCRTYEIEGCKMNQVEQIDLQNKKYAKKITGFQFSPGNPSEVLVTSADSRIRILDGTELVHKFKGFRNINSQISASFSVDGKYVICASEDSNVCIWKREERGANGKNKVTIVNTRSHENFQCRDVSMAILWPGTIKGDPPPPVNFNSKRHSSKRSNNKDLQTNSCCNSPTKDDASVSSKKNNNFHLSDDDSPEENCVNSSATTNNKRQLPPLIPKTEKNNNNNLEEEDSCLVSRSDSDIGSSFASDPSSIRYADQSASSSWSSSWSWFDGSHGNQTVQATAWGMVIVTATLGGEIRAYQNFGLPRRMGRQSNLF